MRPEEVLKEISRLSGSTMLEKIGRGDPYRVLIAAVLSTRTKDEITEKVVDNLFKIAPDPESLSKLQQEELERLLVPIGFYRNKARILLKLAKRLIETGGKVPDNIRELLELPGVGRKVAGCVVVYAYGGDELPVDTHVHRISNRIGWVNTKTPEETEASLKKILPKRLWKRTNGLLVWFGKNICKPVGPRCEVCTIRSACKYYISTYRR